jgi:hypothetical protein
MGKRGEQIPSFVGASAFEVKLDEELTQGGVVMKPSLLREDGVEMSTSAQVLVMDASSEQRRRIQDHSSSSETLLVGMKPCLL